MFATGSSSKAGRKRKRKEDMIETDTGGHHRKSCQTIVKILKIQTSAVIILRFEQCGFTKEMCPNNADKVASSVDPDQTAPSSLIWVYTCLSVCLKIKDHYSILEKMLFYFSNRRPQAASVTIFSKGSSKC